LPAAADIVDTFLASHNDKALKIIGVASEEPIDVLPGVQTFAEAGYPGATAYFWQGIVAPKGTPRDIIDKLHAAIKDVTRTEVFQARLSQDLEVMALAPDDFAAFVQSERDKWEPIMEDLGLKADD